jgi:hypothetical protein
MIRIPKFIVSLGAFALAAGALTLAVPRAARAVAAALVQVTNNYSTPVPVATVARTPYWSTALCVSEVCSTTPVPAGHRLVVQSVSAFNSAPSLYLRTSGNSEGNLQYFYLPGVSAGNGVYLVTAALTAYFDAGAAPNFIGTGLTNGQVTVSGYLEDCTVTSCPAIVN